MEKKYFQSRQQKIIKWLRKNDIDVAILEDAEGRRNSSLAYLTGHPGDALLFIFRKGGTLLLPWDIHLASDHAVCDDIVPYTTFQRKPSVAIKNVLTEKKLFKSRIEISPDTTHPFFQMLTESLPAATIFCRDSGISEALDKMRMIKDPAESAFIRRACEITNSIIEEIAESLRKNRFPSEIDLAHFIEYQALSQGAEGTGFATLVAGPTRSYEIHAFPPYTRESLNRNGLSIIDFGVKLHGYSSDVTLTCLRGNPGKTRQLFLDLVSQAYEAALAQIEPGKSTAEILNAVEEVFANNNLELVHGLGHGLGLDIHEHPIIKSGFAETRLEPGMVFTIEPGLYDKKAGGVRLENDILVTDSGFETLTRSRFIYLS